MKTFKVFPQDATVYTTNGLCILSDIVRAEETERLNKMYSLEMEVLLDDRGKWKHLVDGNIIVVDDQPFRIHQTQTGLYTITVYARHRFWDLYDNEVLDIRPTDKNCLGAMNDVLGALNYATPFTAYSDITATTTQYFIKRNGLDCFVGTDSILTRWGGELKLEGHQIRILSARGLDRGVQIRYRKNMENMEVTEDVDNVITRLRPKGFEGFTLPEVYVDSPLIGNYPFPKIREVEFDVNPADYPTQVDAEAVLRTLATNYIAQTGCDIPQTTIEVDLVLLENTDQYIGRENLVRVFLGDTVTAINERLDITHKLKVVELVRDLLTDRNAKVVLGEVKKTLPSHFTKVANAINDISTALANTKGDLTLAIENATNYLNSAIGGYVKKKENELLIMDTTDESTATKVWRWNLNGLGYSNTGYAGPYGLAMTMDGSINASFITTGTLSASLVKTGILQSFDGTTWLNLDAGTFSFADGRISWDGSTFSVSISQDSEIYQGPTAPPNPDVGRLWMDTSGTEVILKRWNGTTWDIIGINGEDGYTPVKGVDYFDGIDGQDGISPPEKYIHIRYSQNANGDPMTTDPTGAKYIGIIVQENPVASTFPSLYSWSLIKGTDGIIGEDGADGQTSYLHIKYSNDGGATFTANNGETVGTYIGIYVDFNPTDSSNVGDYTWNKVVGDNGTSITAITLQHYISTSKTVLTGGTWTDTPAGGTPNYESDKYLWIRYKTTFANPTSTTYTSPIVDNSWEAVNELETVVTSQGTQISTNTAEILLRATKTEHNALATRVTTAESQITADAIIDTVESKVTTDGSLVLATKSDITQLDDSWTAEFGAMAIGGRNYLLDSGVYVSNNSYLIGNYNLAEPIAHGEPVTITLKGVLGAGKTSFACYNSGGTVQIGALVNIGGGLYQLKTTWRVDGALNTYMSIYTLYSAVVVVSTIDWVKVEKGNKPVTGWLPAQEELYSGVTRIDRDGIHVSLSTSDINTNVAYDGLTVMDGTETIVANFGNAGAIVPSADIGILANDYVIQKVGPLEAQVGSGYQYSTLSQAIDDIFKGTHRLIDQYVNIFVRTDINDNVVIKDIVGGTLNIIITNSARLTGKIEFQNVMSRVKVYGPNSSTYGTIKSNAIPIRAQNCHAVYIFYMNIDGDNGTYGIVSADGSNVQIAACDIVRCTYAMIADNESTARMRDCKGNVATAGRSQYTGEVMLTGTIPVCSSGTRWNTNNAFGRANILTEVASAYSPPAVQYQQFVQTFTSATFDTLIHGTQNIDSYYGSTSAQNRWDSTMGWKDGRIRMSRAIYDFFNGGTNISIRMRLRRKNSTHGSSGAVYPAPYNFTASFSAGAVRGGWTGYATGISTGYFGTGGSTFLLYNGVQGLTGYAIWDAIEVEVTVTKQV